VLDREFSYLELMLNLMEEHINWVIRLNLRAHPPKFYDGEGKEVALTISPGETAVLNKIWYMGKVLVNVIGVWKTGLAEPMWIMTNLEAKRGLQIYYARMKIEQNLSRLQKLVGFDQAHEQTAGIHGENGRPVVVDFHDWPTRRRRIARLALWRANH